MAEIVLCQIEHRGKIGRGECVPYGRYDESIASVVAALENMRPLIDLSNKSLSQIHDMIGQSMPAGAPRNALDCALWDLAAKLEGQNVATRLGIDLQPVTTAYTISLAEPEAMGHQAKLHAHLPLLKIKLGGGSPEEDIARARAVRANAPNATLIVDANEGWQAATIEHCLAGMESCGVALVEQPLPASCDDQLGKIAHRVPVYADESVHETGDLARLQSLYDGINIKLDKAGGLSEALKLKQQAQAKGLGIMIGCMVATSLAMAPALLLAQGVDFVDLDGPLLLARDREPALHYEGGKIFPFSPELWG